MHDDDWKLFKNFKPAEFDSPDQPGSGKYMQFRFVSFLDLMRDELGFPLRISHGGGYRTQEYEEKLKSIKGHISDHTQGLGCDIECDDSQGRFKILQYLFSKGIRRIEICDRHIHIGMSDNLPQDVAPVGISK